MAQPALDQGLEQRRKADEAALLSVISSYGQDAFATQANLRFFSRQGGVGTMRFHHNPGTVGSPSVLHCRFPAACGRQGEPSQVHYILQGRPVIVWAPRATCCLECRGPLTSKGELCAFEICCRLVLQFEILNCFCSSVLFAHLILPPPESTAATLFEASSYARIGCWAVLMQAGRYGGFTALQSMASLSSSDGSVPQPPRRPAYAVRPPGNGCSCCTLYRCLHSACMQCRRQGRASAQHPHRQLGIRHAPLEPCSIKGCRS